jgi:uncharacterized protein YqjF (DUF2071 family)
MAQTWTHLLFAHWPVPVDELRARVPRLFDLDLYEGQAWLGVVPFDLAMIRARGLPPLPGASRFPEINVRTYVTVGGRPGVYFFSLDAANLAAVLTARWFFRLAYRHASMTIEPAGEEVRYQSSRRRGKAVFRGTYAPVGPAFTAAPGSLDEFLVERYCLYTSVAGVRLRLEIDHPAWSLQKARASFDENTMTGPLGLRLEGEPRLHYAHRQETIGWLPYPC